MTELLLLKEKLKSFYAKNDLFIVPIAKFLMTFITLLFINSNIGYMSALSNLFVVILVSLFCAVIPSGGIVLFVTLIMCAHLYSLSMELAVVTLLIFLVMYLFYFRFTAKQAVWVILTLLFFMMKIPYVIPVAAGLLAGIATIIPVVFGTVIYYIIVFAKDYAKLLETIEADDMFENFTTVVTGVLNKEILLLAFAFALTIAIVYVIRRLSVDYAWIYAVVAGSLTDFVMVLVGNVIFSTSVGFLGNLVGLILALIAGYILYVVFFGVDYQRTERVQYEDDSYYYYVKAVPKYSVARADVKVKKINTQKKKRPIEQDYDDIDLNF